nr:hypothetical protein [Tanacetum cinerariifolium]
MNLYNALVDAYECDKIILDTYGDTITLKRRRDDADKDEEPSDGSDRGSKRREGKDAESTSAPKDKASKTKGVADDQPLTEASQHPEWFQKQTKPLTLDRAWNKTLPSTHGSIQPWISNLAKQLDSRSSFNELMDTPVDFLAFLMNRLKVDTLTPELLAGLTYKGYIKWIEDLVPHTMWSQEPVSYDKYALWGISYRGCKRQQFYGFVVNRESAQDVYSKRRIIAVTELQIIEWRNYKHLDWITMRRHDDKLYKFKEGDFNGLRI